MSTTHLHPGVDRRGQEIKNGTGKGVHIDEKDERRGFVYMYTYECRKVKVV